MNDDCKDESISKKEKDHSRVDQLENHRVLARLEVDVAADKARFDASREQRDRFNAARASIAEEDAAKDRIAAVRTELEASIAEKDAAFARLDQEAKDCIAAARAFFFVGGGGRIPPVVPMTLVVPVTLVLAPGALYDGGPEEVAVAPAPVAPCRMGSVGVTMVTSGQCLAWRVAGCSRIC